jgi:hypothetical protein
VPSWKISFISSEHWVTTIDLWHCPKFPNLLDRKLTIFLSIPLEWKLEIAISILCTIYLVISRLHCLIVIVSRFPSVFKGRTFPTRLAFIWYKPLRYKYSAWRTWNPDMKKLEVLKKIRVGWGGFVLISSVVQGYGHYTVKKRII